MTPLNVTGTSGEAPKKVSTVSEENGLLLRPVANLDILIEAFKQYVEMKDRLLEPDDYLWCVTWHVGQDRQERKFFKHKSKAEKYYATLTSKGIEVELEKRIKKSGCLKLGKAFCISDYPVEEVLDREKGYAYYKVRAQAPNGQYKERTGTCDRNERGKRDVPFDTIMATALTRAADRAIMALLGGETTAEEFEEGVDSTENASQVDPPMTHEEAVQKIKEKFGALDEKFEKVKEANEDTERNRLNRRLWKALKYLYGKEAETRVHNTCKRRYGCDSLTKLSDDQLKELTEAVEGLAAKKAVGDRNPSMSVDAAGQHGDSVGREEGDRHGA